MFACHQLYKFRECFKTADYYGYKFSNPLQKFKLQLAVLHISVQLNEQTGHPHVVVRTRSFPVSFNMT